MRCLTHALVCLYAIVALGLIRCAAVSHQQGDIPHAALYAAAASLLAVAIVHHTYHRDELRAALLRLDHASKPPGPTEQQIAAEIARGHRQLDSLCCWTFFETASSEHDPGTCTRKDQTA